MVVKVRPPEHLGSALLQSDLGGEFPVALVDIVIAYLAYPAFSGKCFVLHEHNRAWAECLLVLTNGRVVCGYMDHGVRVWDANDVAQSFCLSMQGHTGNVLCLAELPDGSVVSGARDGTLRVWDTNTGVCKRILLGHEQHVTCVGVLPDGRVVSGSNDGSVRVWDVSSAEVRVPTVVKLQGQVYALSVLRDGRVLIGGYRSLVVWDGKTGECTPTMSQMDPFGTRITALLELTDGRVVLCDLSEDTVRVLNLATGTYISLRGSCGQVRRVAELPDGRVVTGAFCKDATLRVWDTYTGECTDTLRPKPKREKIGYYYQYGRRDPKNGLNGVRGVGVLSDGSVVASYLDCM